MTRDEDVFVLNVCVSVQQWQSIDKQMKQESMFANIYILANLLSPALCWNMTTSTIWIPHPRKIRGNDRNACFVAKCTFQRKLRVVLRNARIIAKCTFRWKNTRCALLCKNNMRTWLVARCKLPLALENASVVKNCVLCRWIKKMRVSLKNAHLNVKCPMCREIIMHISWENACFVEKCLISRKKTIQTYSVGKCTFRCIMPI